MKRNSIQISGNLITLPLPGADRPLDGFWVHGPRPKRRLLIIVHGMGSNFYRSRFKKEIMRQAGKSPFDVLSFNNRGSEQAVATEKFTYCMADIDAAMRFGRRHGYRSFVLLGHSTGCQKITYFQAMRRSASVDALVLAGLGDDLAICRRDLGRAYHRWLKRARRLVATGRGKTILPRMYLGFSARRFLSIADPRQLEARLFDFSGPMSHFRKITRPVLAIWGDREEYACLPVRKMGSILREKSRSRNFGLIIVPGANHGFHGKEQKAVRAIFGWLRRL